MIDFEIAYFLNHLGSGTLVDNLSIALSSYAFIIVFWAFICVLILYFDRKNGKYVVAAMVIAALLHFAITEGIFKYLLPQIIHFRARPYLAFPAQIIPLGVHAVDTSFPSGHMSLTLALSSVVVFYYRKYWPYGAVFAILMAFSRIHNGMHYLTDILGGTVLGIIYGWMAFKVSQKMQKKLSLDKKSDF
jgi:undecaprenyl-diphosphatase